MPTKAPRAPERASLSVQLQSQPTQATCTSLVQALLKHLLYARGHIPHLYDQLLQQALEEQQAALEEQQEARPGRKRRRRRTKKSDKRRLQFLQRAQALLDCVAPELFATDGPTRCYVLLGASTSRPREAYELLLPAATPGAPGAGEPGTAVAARDDYACRVFLRQLITSAPDLPEGSAAQHPGKVFLLVQAPAGQALPAGFVPKRAFRLAMRKGVHVTLSLGGAALQQRQQEGRQQQEPPGPQQHVGEAMQEECGPQDESTVQQHGMAADSHAGGPALPLGGGAEQQQQQQPTTVWLQCKWVLRGLKCGSDMGMG